MNDDRLTSLIAEVLPSITELRHDLHRHPELAYEEVRTAGKVVESLAGIDGLEIKTGIAGTGVVVILGADLEGPCVALRADMDALPIEEASGVEWTSRTPGKMHACGHDGHTAMLVGAIKVLAAMKDHLKGPVKFVFQPAEEGGAGALKMCQEGVLDNPPVAAIFGLHNNLPESNLTIGQIGYRSGATMAGTGTFDIEVIGHGGHAAYPHKVIDPLYIGACIVEQLQGIVARILDPLTPAVVSVTRFHAGSAYNVIAEKALLQGTFRALDEAILVELKDHIVRIANEVASAHRARAEIRCDIGYPVLVNHPDAEAVFLEIIKGSMFKDELRVFEATLGGEDFAFYGQRVPAFFYFLPACPVGQSSNPACHHPAFEFNDDNLPRGIRLHAELALGFADHWKP
jgi:amidohydrolase